jgi:hypothetical protein
MNPFPQIVELFNDEYKLLTNNILDHIGLSIKHAGFQLQTRDQAFAVLEYLAENGALDLIETESKTFLIRKRHYGNETN